MTLRDLVKPQLAILHRTVAERAGAARLLASLPVRAWPGAIQSEPALRSVGALHYVLDRAKEELFRNPRVGLRLIRAVLRHAPGDPVLRGRALRLHAHGEHLQGNHDAAKRAIGQSLAILSTEPAGALELLHARLFDAYLRNQTNDGDVLMDVRLVAKAFAAHGDAAGVLMSRLTEANILFERDELARAMTVNRDALQIAEKLDDRPNQAIALANLGHCAQQLSSIEHRSGVPLRAQAYADEAMGFYARATPLYAALGMDAESQRIVWAMAGLAQQRGNLAQARAQLLRVREEFLHRGMYLSAALVALDLMELLVMADRRDLVASWYDEVEETFVRGGMPRYAIEALSRVRAAAHESPIDAPFLAKVRAAVRNRFKKAA